MSVKELLLVRHGESTANVAREDAEESSAEVIPVRARDADVPLSPLGQRQAVALGEWLATQDTSHAITAVYSSPYVRAQQTAAGVVASQWWTREVRLDERLRDKELGVLDTLTSAGVRARFPEEQRRREWLGKFYYRAPGGESWADVALRLRSFLHDLAGRPHSERVLVVTHDSVVTLFRYICQELDEATLLGQAEAEPIANASLTRLLKVSDERWELADFNRQDHLVTADGTDLRTVHAARVQAEA